MTTKLLLATILLATGGTVAVYHAPVLGQQGARHEQTLARAPSPRTKSAEKQTLRTDAHGDPLPPDALARIGTVRMRPGGSVRLLAFAPDGKTIVSAAGERAGNSISVWDVA